LLAKLDDFIKKFYTSTILTSSFGKKNYASVQYHSCLIQTWLFQWSDLANISGRQRPEILEVSTQWYFLGTGPLPELLVSGIKNHNCSLYFGSGKFEQYKGCF